MKRIETSGEEALHSFSEAELLNQYRGCNMFMIDLKEVERFLLDQYADIDTVVVRKVLPDRLSAEIKVRKAVALVRDEKYIPIDREGVILANIRSSEWNITASHPCLLRSLLCRNVCRRQAIKPGW